MIRPTPLRVSTRQLAVQKVLESALADAPPKGASDRALLALGVAGAVTGAAAAASAAGAAASTSPIAAAKASLPFWVKWVGMAVLGGSVASVPIVYTSHEAEAPLAALPADPAPPSRVPRKRPDVRLPADAADVTVLPAGATPGLSQSAPHDTVASPRAVRGSVRASAESAPTRTASSVHALEAQPDVAATDPSPRAAVVDTNLPQLVALQAARRALAAHAPGEALRLLDDFEQRFAGAALAEEATVLRVDALLAAGDLAAARTLGDAFARAHPDSLHLERMRRKLQ